jgi:predicted GTPase
MRIKAKADEYEHELKRREQHHLDALKAKQEERRQRNQPIKEVDIEDRARKQSERDMKERGELVAAHEQFQMMRTASDPAQPQACLEVDDEHTLATSLHDYVGAGGRYMPFTKSVDIAMPLESLKGLRIIDTPGLNDPVQSREARTVELLKECDVIFIVSPAGQFLNEQDQELMSRITQREGVRELILVCSQVDTSLTGSEKRPTLDETLETLRSSMSKRAQVVLSDMHQQNDPVFDELLKSSRNSLLLSSGMCGALYDRFDERTSWNEPEQHVWKNLINHFPDYFSEGAADISRTSLKKLANTDALHGVIDRVAERKDQIVKDKLAHLSDTKYEWLESFQANIIRALKQCAETVENTDIGELAAQRELLNSHRSHLQSRLDGKYRDFKNANLLEMENQLFDKVGRVFGDTEDNFSKAESTKPRTRKRKKEGLLPWLGRKIGWGGYEQSTDDLTQLRTPKIISMIEAFARKAKQSIDESAELTRKRLDEDLSYLIIQVLTKVFGDQLNRDQIYRAMNRVLEPFRQELEQFDPQIPDHLRGRGTLKNSRAEEFKDELDEFMAQLKNRTDRHIERLIKQIRSAMPEKLSDDFASVLNEQIERLESQVKSRQQTLDRIARLLTEAETIRPPLA